MKKLLIILLFPIAVNAQSRFYIGAAQLPFAPVVNAAWNVTSTYSKRTIGTGVSRTNAGFVSDATGAVAVRKILTFQFFTIPLAAQTIDGTITGQTLFKLSSAASGGVMQGFAYLRVLNPDYSVASEVGTLTTTNLTTTLTNRTLIALTLSSLVITTGQRLCIEIGGNYSAGTLTTATVQVNFVGDGTADLPVNNTSTSTTLNSWVEFSQTLIFQRPGNGFF